MRGDGPLLYEPRWKMINKHECWVVVPDLTAFLNIFLALINRAIVHLHSCGRYSYSLSVPL